MEIIKRKKGITLVSLVITIIVLLLVVGITVSKLTKNDLVEIVKNTKEKSENVQNIENSILSNYESEIEHHISANRDDNKKVDIEKLPTIEGIYSISAQNINYNYEVTNPGIYIIGVAEQGNSEVTTTGKKIKENIIVPTENKARIYMIDCDVGDKINILANNYHYNAGAFIVKANNLDIKKLIAVEGSHDTTVTSTYTAVEDTEIILAISFSTGEKRNNSISYNNVFLTSYYHMNNCFIDVAILKKGSTVTAQSYAYSWSNATTYIFK